MSTNAFTKTGNTVVFTAATSGFIQVDLNGTVVKVPYYAV